MFKFLLIFFSLILSTFADDKTDEKNLDLEDELTITSRHLDYDYSNRKAVFQREVKAINGETVLTSEKMTCFFDKENQPYLIIAEEDVVIVRGHHQAKAHKASYEIPKGKIILRNQPLLFDGTNTIKGRVITFYRDDKKTPENNRYTEVLDPEVTFQAEKNKLTKTEKKKP